MTSFRPWPQPTGSGRATPFALGSGTVADPFRKSITRDGRTRAVEPRVMELLVYLAERPGKIVSKHELVERVWKAHVVDEAVHRAMSLLRAALGDSMRPPTIIETIPRQGYRLLVRPSRIAHSHRIIGKRLAAAAAAALFVAFAWTYGGPDIPAEPPGGLAEAASPAASIAIPSPVELTPPRQPAEAVRAPQRPLPMLTRKAEQAAATSTQPKGAEVPALAPPAPREATTGAEAPARSSGTAPVAGS